MSAGPPQAAAGRRLRLVLVGDPVGHSRSPAIHAAALAVSGIDGSYEARRVDAAGFASAIHELRAGELDGMNVTMPHKRRAAAACSIVSAGAERAQAVNTLRMTGSLIGGWNTDVDALRIALSSMPAGPVLVVGAGGAGAGAVMAAEGRQLRITARRPDSARDLADRVGASASVVPWGQGVAGAIVVNATPIGMKGEPLPEGLLAEAAGLIDLAYGSSETPAVGEARRRSIPAIDGVEMLVAQAAESFRIWTGVEPPVEAMRAAARKG